VQCRHDWTAFDEFKADKPKRKPYIKTTFKNRSASKNRTQLNWTGEVTSSIETHQMLNNNLVAPIPSGASDFIWRDNSHYCHSKKTSTSANRTHPILFRSSFHPANSIQFNRFLLPPEPTRLVSRVHQVPSHPIRLNLLLPFLGSGEKSCIICPWIAEKHRVCCLNCLTVYELAKFLKIRIIS